MLNFELFSKGARRSRLPVRTHGHVDKLFLSVICFVITEMPHIQPMIVAIWFGTKKPTDYNEYLQPFVSELKEILANGVVVNGHLITVLFHCCVCDSPARAYIKGTS